MKTIGIALSALALGIPAADAALYSADFSTAGIGFTHTTATPPAAGPQSASGPNWEVSYPGTPLTDGSTNSFITAAGALTASDWGGDGAFKTSPIDVSSETSITISLVGSGTFNTAPAEYFTWYYTLDGGTPVTVSMATGSNVSYNQTWDSVDVSTASTLEVGFTFSHNGSSDGFNITSVTVVPEPSIALLGGIGLLGLLRRRR